MQEYGGALESLLQVLGVNLVEKLPGHSLAPRIAAQQERALLGWAGHTLALAALVDTNTAAEPQPDTRCLPALRRTAVR